jgi:hypothetical protein
MLCILPPILAVGAWIGVRALQQSTQQATEMSAGASATNVNPGSPADSAPDHVPGAPLQRAMLVRAPDAPASDISSIDPLSPAHQRIRQRLLFEAAELMRQLEGLPQRYDLFSPLGRQEARGCLLIHLMTLEDLSIPASVAKLWGLRRASVERVVQGLDCAVNSKEESRLFDEATQLLTESRGLEAAIRAELPRAKSATMEEGQPAVAEDRGRESAKRQAEEARRASLYSALHGAQMLEDQARREVESVRAQPQRRDYSSALKTAEAILRIAEDGTRKARQAYEDYVEGTRR